MNIKFIDKIGTIGIFLTALLSPCCFPLFAVIASTLGLGTFEPFGGWTMYVFQFLVLISLIGFVIAYLNHKAKTPLVIGIISSSLIFFTFYIDFNQNIIFAGMLGLLIGTILNYRANKKCNACRVIDEKDIELKSMITCPECGFQKQEMMPRDSCQFFYECTNCKKVVRPKKGDCCVFCSYGSIKCPSIQKNANCC